MGIAAAKSKMQGKAASPKGNLLAQLRDTDRLFCERGRHHWRRRKQKGAKPKSCPEHKPRPPSEPKGNAKSNGKVEKELTGLAAIRAKNKVTLIRRLRAKREQAAREAEVERLLDVYARASQSYENLQSKLKDLEKRYGSKRNYVIRQRYLKRLDAIFDQLDTLQNTQLRISASVFKMRGFGVLAREVDERLEELAR